jgi:hypothetical protein
MLTLALFDLVTRPEYIGPLQEEVQSVIETHGWTKDAIDAMEKLDSFLKESLRFNSAGARELTFFMAIFLRTELMPNSVSLRRKAMKDVTFSDGTFVPKGTTVSAIMKARQCDEKLYANAKVFDGFRFSNMQFDKSRKSVTSVGLDFLPFGHGRHAWYVSHIFVRGRCGSDHRKVHVASSQRWR